MVEDLKTHNMLRKGPNNNIILHPKPTDDYDDPLVCQPTRPHPYRLPRISNVAQNWSTRRKVLHFGIVLFYIAVSFMVVDAQLVAHLQITDNLGMNHDDIATASAVKFAGLGLTGIALIPLAYRYGRRPIYLTSALVQIVASTWLAFVDTKYEYLVCSVLVGVGAAATQTLVPMTIADLFFVHQFATMNGWFLFAQGTGAFLGPVAAGYVVMLQGWRWIGAWTAILLGIAFLLILFLLEESTFVPTALDQDIKLKDDDVFFYRPFSYGSTTEHVDLVDINRRMTTKTLELPPGPKTLRQRFALITRTKRPIKERFLAPFVILISFPAVAYAAVTYGSIMAWLAMYEHVAATKLFSAPYNFDAKDMGLFGIPPFIGHSIGSLVIPALSDRWMVKLARQNGGIYQPEMRLRLAIPGAIFTCAGILIFGIGIAKVRMSFTLNLI